MMPASLLAEAIRNQESVTFTRERLAATAHVAQNNRAIALPALAAAARHTRDLRKIRAAIPGTSR